MRNLFEQILVVQANRLAEMDTVSREDLMRITAADIRVAQGKSPEENEIEKAVRESSQATEQEASRQDLSGKTS